VRKYKVKARELSDREFSILVVECLHFVNAIKEERGWIDREYIDCAEGLHTYLTGLKIMHEPKDCPMGKHIHQDNLAKNAFALCDLCIGDK
jgi:hypothetical protein